MPISRQQAWDGKAAEHIVISELLKRGHTPFIPIIDTGVDIIVKSKSKNCYYELQVKSNNSPIKDNQQWLFSEVVKKVMIVTTSIDDLVKDRKADSFGDWQAS